MRRIARIRARAVAAALATAAAAATIAPSAAQSVYKSTLPDGRIVYGGKPEKGAMKVEKMAPAAPVVEVDPKEAEAQRQREKAQVEQLDKRLALRRAAREQADAEILVARDAVSAAEKGVAAGKEPRPGERVATTDGGSRLSEAYFDRVKGLEDELRLAKERLDRAFRDRTILD